MKLDLESLTHNQKIGITLSVIVIMFVASLRLIDGYTEQMIDASLHQGVVAFASIRGLHAIISLLEGTEVHVAIINVSIGELLSPATEILETASTVLTTALASLGLQKILLQLVSKDIFNILVAISGAGFILTLWRPLSGASVAIIRTSFVVICLTRFILVLALLLNGAIDSLFLNNQAQALTAHTQLIKADVKQFQSEIPGMEHIYTEPNPHPQLESSEVPQSATEEQGFWDSMASKAKQLSHEASQMFESTPDSADAQQSFSERFEHLQNSMEDLVQNLLDIMALFVLKTILLPIGFLLLLKKLISRTLFP
ncbi:hypothetical protein [Vibrio gallicus]|uniref:hypothetical protein n=1 Tax=Vibrio gallicus TaxID=190897 RepID=UPI0021C3FE8A|nr:hypothetical protein [Vibrio gallicus]